MKKHLLPLLLLTLASCTQRDSNIWREYEIDAADAYPIQSEGEVYLSDLSEGNDVIAASILVRSEGIFLGSIKFCSATLVEDTLKITLYASSPAYRHEYLILISQDRYLVHYRFSLGDGLFDKELVPFETRLKMNSKQFKKGITIRGYTGFKSRCIEPCEGGLFFASGNFKATIQ